MSTFKSLLVKMPHKTSAKLLFWYLPQIRKQYRGFIAVGQIDFESLPARLLKRIPRYPIPIARLARLAIDKNVQGQHLGQKLLMDALRRCTRISQEIGLFGIVVDAKHDKAKQFYQKYGFLEIHNQPLTLFLRMSTVLKII